MAMIELIIVGVICYLVGAISTAVLFTWAIKRKSAALLQMMAGKMAGHEKEKPQNSS
jgi:hypothetical protein